MASVPIVRALVAALYLTSGASALPLDKVQDATARLADIQHQALQNAYKVLDGTLAQSPATTTLSSFTWQATHTLRTCKHANHGFLLQNMTPAIHSTANFMHWHCYFVLAYEAALRNECQYAGYQPYWDWSKYSDLVHSPIFNGDEWSMGSNGDATGPYGSVTLSPATLPGGPGGGCVTSDILGLRI